MEIWIATGNKRELRKKYPFLKEYGVIDQRDIAKEIGYKSMSEITKYAAYVLNEEIIKKLVAFNKSKRIYRVLYIVETYRDDLPQDLLNYTGEHGLKYESVFYKPEDVFVMVHKNY